MFLTCQSNNGNGLAIKLPNIDFLEGEFIVFSYFSIRTNFELKKFFNVNI